MRSNALTWSPTFPTSILLASEDHNLYTFDIRQLVSPTQIYKGHVAAVMSCDWSPTGTEFVSGSWDRTVRIWREGEGRGRETYHGKRMQRCVYSLCFFDIGYGMCVLMRDRVFSTTFTGDARYVLSGSDDGNLRIWKAKAWEKLGIVDTRERAAIEYRERLKERWKEDGEVGRIVRFVFISLLTFISPISIFLSA
jgi:WD repeat and SOF domain-containing protein 1